ncbi:TolC family protein [Aquincola tertiaricarbonis]|uniref:TolC family protein n=1 Tax=Aquincola tertiaricarbonis TaxID=391953 RepID=A0ABY4SB47_AQUTE|nr:TolC family protein [Aquincola tertiaricarbonis]URI09390.1 TolC family protein [Aquincola tertiaricarbonis]
MKPLPWLSACVIAGSLAGGPAVAQPATPVEGPRASLAADAGLSVDRVPLRTALDAAWQRTVVARESDGQRRRAEAERAAADSLWAAPPSLEISHRSDRLQSNTGRRETELGVAIPLWLPGQRAARAGTADAAAAQAQAAALAARLRLAGELREVAWQVAALQAEVAQADAQTQALKQLADDVARRVRAGDLARADALAAQAEHLAASALQTEGRQRLQAAHARWTLLTGLAAAPDLAGPAGEETTRPVAPHPELQLASQSTQLARQRAELMRRSRRDAPELTLGVRQDVPGRAEATQGSLVVGLRLPFGTDDRNRPLEAAALAELDVAETHELRLREKLDSDTAAAREALRSAEAQLEAETTRARLLRERATLIDKSFRAGETPLPDQLRALAAAGQADSAVARQTAALGLAHARLQQALGLLP